MFPKSIGQIMHKEHIEELHLTFTQGRWSSERWGLAPFAAPAGVQIWSWFGGEGERNATEEEKEKNWGGIVRALGGLFCASLQYMDSTKVASPDFMLRPQGNISSRASLKYSTLTTEAVCTENLTPWAKLLPCRKEAGLSTLFRSPKVLYDVHWHSMGLHITQSSDNGEGYVFLTQSLTMVVGTLGTKALSLKSLFGVPGISDCPLSDASTIKILKPKEKSFEIQSAAPISDREDYWMIDLKSTTSPLDVRFTINESPKHIPTAAFLVNRYQTGFGKQKGGITTIIKNNLNVAVNTSMLQVIPWFLQLYFHTMVTKINEKPFHKFYLKNVIPGEDRVSPSKIEFKFALPPKSTFTFEIEYDKFILHFFEYPPDPNRGFDIGPALVEAELPCYLFTHLDDNLTKECKDTLKCANDICDDLSIITNLTRKYQFFTTGLSISMPTPDFSMPYNVITLTCTMIAFFFGQTLRILTRRYSEVYVDGNFVSNRPAAKLLDWILSLIQEDTQ
uniref:GPI transamidase component PIG-T n=1 Tax=Arcella intermedia TaxID=1963864 RepID=A0A6B2L1F9_9EUKA